ncbi:hypothetical protein N7489_006962, partial [Penicillium chrysogenum]|uniref:uncharacterized protein n=1 Tax=Penicillium chrysogenum TaxID=5076 RepID=UPI002393AD8F
PSGDLKSAVLIQNRLSTSYLYHLHYSHLGNDIPEDIGHQALITLGFPRSVELPMLPLPSTSNPLTAYSYDSTFAFAVPHQRAPELVTAVQKIPYNGPSGE